MRKLIVIAHNIRSTHNVGSLLRTADGLGIEKVYLTGYTPYPLKEHDERLPHLAKKIDKDIHKTALGAESTVDWAFQEDVFTVISRLEKSGYSIITLEQSDTAAKLSDFKASGKIALLLGSEVTGVPTELLNHVTSHVYIPMFGKKESFNVVQAAAMALYQFRFF